MIRMELIDRYVHAVTERLPESTREDVAKELRANIEDMLPEEPTESDVRAVLEKLGNPVALSNEYRQEKKYLISPAVYDTYIYVLKLVIGIAVVAFMFLALLGYIARPLGGEGFEIWPQVFGDILGSGIDGALQAFLWVTVVFAVLDRTGVTGGNIPFINKKWTVDDLKPVQVSGKSRISRGEAIVSFAFTVIFTAILVYQPQLIGIYMTGDIGLVLSAPLFQVDRLQAYFPVIILLAVLQLCISTYKIILLRWTLPLAMANTVNNLVLSILVSIMAYDTTLFHPDFISGFAGIFNISVNRMTSILHNSLTAFVIVFIVLCAIDSINGFVKSRKKRWA